MASSARPGRFCREIHVTVEPGRAVGELIDDFHHFRATVEHDGTRIRTVTGEALRIPWQTCAGAVNPLRRLDGQPLESTTRGVGRLAPSRLQCTHLYDAACIAAARAGRDAGSVSYRAIVPDRVGGRASPTLHRNGEPFLAWEIDGYTVVGPAPFAGRALAGGDFASFAEEDLDAETCEAALILNRACMFSFGRALALDDCPRAIDVPGTSLGVCHTYSEAQGPLSFRIVGSARHIAEADDARRASLAPTAGDIQLLRRT